MRVILLHMPQTIISRYLLQTSSQTFFRAFSLCLQKIQEQTAWGKKHIFYRRSKKTNAILSCIYDLTLNFSYFLSLLKTKSNRWLQVKMKETHYSTSVKKIHKIKWQQKNKMTSKKENNKKSCVLMLVRLLVTLAGVECLLLKIGATITWVLRPLHTI